MCKESRVVYVDKNGNLQENYCEDILSANIEIKLNNEALFSKCYNCKMFSLCNGCSSNKAFTENIKEEHCAWMKENENRLKKYEIL